MTKTKHFILINGGESTATEDPLEFAAWIADIIAQNELTHFKSVVLTAYHIVGDRLWSLDLPL